MTHSSNPENPEEQSAIRNPQSAIETRVFVTGAGGFVGKHLLRYLSAHTNWRLFANAFYSGEAIDMPGVEWFTIDLADRDNTAAAVGEVKPDYVFHLAAQSNVQRAFKDPQATIVNNV